MDKKKNLMQTQYQVQRKKTHSSGVLEEFLVARSNERNTLVKQQQWLIRADSTLNTKGKKATSV
jgi:hypothetical protein